MGDAPATMPPPAPAAREEPDRANRRTLDLLESVADGIVALSWMLSHGLRNPLAPIRNSLAVLKRAAPPPPPREAAAAPAPARRVLVIEDSVDAAQSLKDVLELDGHEVVVAHDGASGLSRARAFLPEFVFCDIGLPGMDGFEVARAFRADAALQGAYLVALSGYALPEDQARSAEAGFRRHLAKPPDLSDIEELLRDPLAGLARERGR